MTRLILCADDYAIAPGVSRAIVRLIEKGRLSATSCLTVSRLWPEHVGWLKPQAGRADIGLHLALTGFPPLGAMPRTCPDGNLPTLAALMRDALLRRLDRAEIEAEILRQVDAFTTAFGRPPAFIDGHQHVHQLPVVREAVLAVWRRRLADSGAWLRVCDDTLPTILGRNVATTKSLVIAGFGRSLRRRAVRLGVPVNDRFAGVHDFSGRVPYAALFERFIAGATGRLVVMCHPGVADEELSAVDPVTTAREDELQFFESAAFPELVGRAGLTLGRFS